MKKYGRKAFQAEAVPISEDYSLKEPRVCGEYDMWKYRIWGSMWKAWEMEEGLGVQAKRVIFLLKTLRSLWNVFNREVTRWDYFREMILGLMWVMDGSVGAAQRMSGRSGKERRRETSGGGASAEVWIRNHPDQSWVTGRRVEGKVPGRENWQTSRYKGGQKHPAFRVDEKTLRKVIYWDK